MKTEITSHDIDQLQEKNIGFQFLYDREEAQTSAILRLQWCLTPLAGEYLKAYDVVDAKVFLVVTLPSGRVERYTAPLNSDQELLEFHRAGVHTISGKIVWGSEIADAERRFLKKDSRYGYEHAMDTVLHSARVQAFCDAEISVDVPDGFFAPAISARKWWYINLWYGEPAWDECEIRRRTITAYLKTPLIAAWVAWLFVIRLVIAFWMSFMLGRRGIPWAAVVHPFEYKTAFLWENSYSFHSWITRDKKGKPRFGGARFFTPWRQVLIILLTGFFGGIFFHWEGWVIAYVAVMGVLLFGFSSISSSVDAWIEKREVRKGAIQEQRKQERLETFYSGILCTAAPPLGLRTSSPRLMGRVKLAYHAKKVDVCRPVSSR